MTTCSSAGCDGRPAARRRRRSRGGCGGGSSSDRLVGLCHERTLPPPGRPWVGVGRRISRSYPEDGSWLATPAATSASLHQRVAAIFMALVRGRGALRSLGEHDNEALTIYAADKVAKTREYRHCLLRLGSRTLPRRRRRASRLLLREGCVSGSPSRTRANRRSGEHMRSEAVARARGSGWSRWSRGAAEAACRRCTARVRLVVRERRRSMASTMKPVVPSRGNA